MKVQRDRLRHGHETSPFSGAIQMNYEIRSKRIFSPAFPMHEQPQGLDTKRGRVCYVLQDLLVLLSNPFPYSLLKWPFNIYVGKRV